MPLIEVGVTFNFYPRSAVFSATYKTQSWTNTDCIEALDMIDTPVLQHTAGPVGSGGGTLTIVAYGHTYTYTIDSIYDDSTYDTIKLPSDNLYAWTSSTAQCYGFPTTFYTKTATIEVPTYGGTNLIFDANGNDITSTFLYGGTAHFSESSEQSITWSTSDPF